MNERLYLQDDQTGRTVSIDHLLPELSRLNIEPGDITGLEAEPMQDCWMVHVTAGSKRASMRIENRYLRDLFGQLH